MKKFLFLCAVCMTAMVGLTACGNSDNNNTQAPYEDDVKDTNNTNKNNGGNGVQNGIDNVEDGINNGIDNI